MAHNQEEASDKSTTLATTLKPDFIGKSELTISPATLEALKTLSSIDNSAGLERLTDCDRLTASLEQIRANKNVRLFEKLDKIRQDFSGLNSKIAQMEESILDLKKVTHNLVKSLPPDRETS